jgi:regulator of nucleoside diphosphate kinase
MAQKTITISENDYKRLQELMAQGRRINFRANRYLRDLQRELSRAQILPADQVPSNVITMDSTARLMDLDTERETEFTLVFPDDADPDQNKISVLAPIGCAMLGYREGDEFEWETPDGNRRLRVVKVLNQPQETDPNAVADAAGTMEEQPYPERRYPTYSDELADSEEVGSTAPEGRDDRLGDDVEKWERNRPRVNPRSDDESPSFTDIPGGPPDKQ